MKVVILCGGEGLRLRELTDKIPKPLIEIGGKPILWHIMKIYAHYGHNDFILCLGYKGDKIKEYFDNNGNEFGSVAFVDTGLNATRAERLKKVERMIEDDNFFLAYGDDVSDVDINSVVDFHMKNKKIATMTSVKMISQYGILKLNNKNEITAFDEKPILDYWINGGFFVLNNKIFSYIKSGMELDQVFGKLAGERQVCAFKHTGFWKSMNTLKDVKELNDIWESGHALWKVWK